tara:strand:- start:1979 stop:2596 length:618 start_codon:yes stop_codon:yes gene_type:complete
MPPKKKCFTRVRMVATPMGPKGSVYQGCATPKAKPTRPKKEATPQLESPTIDSPKKKLIEKKKKVVEKKKPKMPTKASTTKVPTKKTRLIIKKKPVATTKKTTTIRWVKDSEARWNMTRLFGRVGPKEEILYLRNGKIYEEEKGGKATAKLVNGKIVFPGKMGLILDKSPTGFYYDKEGFKKDWWKGDFPNKGQLSTSGYEYNIV